MAFLGCKGREEPGTDRPLQTQKETTHQHLDLGLQPPELGGDSCLVLTAPAGGAVSWLP